MSKEEISEEVREQVISDLTDTQVLEIAEERLESHEIAGLVDDDTLMFEVQERDILNYFIEGEFSDHDLITLLLSRTNGRVHSTMSYESKTKLIMDNEIKEYEKGHMTIIVLEGK